MSLTPAETGPDIHKSFPFMQDGGKKCAIRETQRRFPAVARFVIAGLHLAKKNLRLTSG